MKVNDIQKAKNVISHFFVDHDCEQLSDHELRLNGYFSEEEIMKISEKMVQNGVIFTEFRPAYHDIETYFTSIIENTKAKG